MSLAMKPNKKSTGKRGRPATGRVPLHVTIPAPLSDALKRFMDESRPRRTEQSPVVEYALAELLTQKGYWPPKKPEVDD